MSRMAGLQDEKKTNRTGQISALTCPKKERSPVPVQKRKCKGYPKEYREEPLQIRNHVLSRVNMEAS